MTRRVRLQLNCREPRRRSLKLESSRAVTGQKRKYINHQQDAQPDPRRTPADPVVRAESLTHYVGRLRSSCQSSAAGSQADPQLTQVRSTDQWSESVEPVLNWLGHRLSESVSPSPNLSQAGGFYAGRSRSGWAAARQCTQARSHAWATSQMAMKGRSLKSIALICGFITL